LEFFKELSKKIEEDKHRFHMPGHKGKESVVYDVFKDIVKFDFTEIDGTDNLNNPRGIIKNLQNRLSNLYGTKKSYILVNGSTSGIQSAILSQSMPKDKILIQRDCHKAVYNSLIIGDLDCEFIWTGFDTSLKLKKTLDLKELEQALEENEIKLVVVTYPTYYGICSNIEKIAEIVHRKGALLIVDEAHGGHLKFSKKLPKGAEDLGADIVIQSLHKTLPALTQTSAVHVCSRRVDVERLETFIKMFQTSSPSYILMLSVESALNYMEEKGSKNLDKIVEYLRECIENDSDNIFMKKSYIEKELNCQYDDTKLLISLYNNGIRGYKVKDELKKQGIYTELWDLVYNIAYITGADSIEDISLIFSAVKRIENNVDKDKTNNIEFKKFKPARKMTINNAFYKPKTHKRVEDLKGEIAGDFVIPYPPGIPLICPGELIEEDHVEYIKELQDENIEILGIKDDKISVLFQY